MPQRRRPRVLFVSHDAHRAGATIFLFNMVRWLQQDGAIEASVMLRAPGEMQAAFADIAPTFVAGTAPPSALLPARRWIGRGHKLDWTATQLLQALTDRGGFDLLYLNTLVNGDLVEATSLGTLPVVSHVHELGFAIRRFGRGREAAQLARSDLVIGVSDAVTRNLAGQHGCPAAKLHRVYGFTPINDAADGAPPREAVLAQAGLPVDALVVGLCGYGDLRKGVDLVVPLARLLPAEVAGRPLHLVWLGRLGEEYPEHLALHDRKTAGLAARVHFVGSTTRPRDWMSAFDLHLLLAREDPFPLVVMESAALGVPTVCFDGAGGASEFVRDDAGLVCPYLDLTTLAQRLVGLLADGRMRLTMGEAARRRVLAEHAPDVVLPEIRRLIVQTAATRGGPAP